jgi:hypothetical protein
MAMRVDISRISESAKWVTENESVQYKIEEVCVYGMRKKWVDG